MSDSIQCLLSLPPAMARDFSSLFTAAPQKWFASCDPPGGKLGSGGGIAQLLVDACRAEDQDFFQWMDARKRLVLLAGGQSRRLPAYASTGKVLMPVPVMRWSYGQRLDQSLLDLQAGDYTRILAQAPEDARVLVASGDVFLKFPDQLPQIPSADVVGFGMMVSPEVASHFGVFFCPRSSPEEVAFFLQKPTPEKIRELAREYSYFVDTGLWLLGRQAVDLLMRRCGWSQNSFQRAQADNYELYAGLGPALGSTPSQIDPEINALSVRVVPLPDAEFYHFGTTRQMIESLSELQNRPTGRSDQDDFWRKPHPDMYVINSSFAFKKRLPDHKLLWIENCSLPDDFVPSGENALTGIPDGDWTFELRPGDCIDFVPIGSNGYAIRNYGFDDSFSGPLHKAHWMGRPALSWFEERGISLLEAGLDPDTDIQESPLFAVLDTPTSAWVDWLLQAKPLSGAKETWLSAKRFSARELGEQINLHRLFQQRRQLSSQALGRFWQHRASNPFFRVDLENAASIYAAANHPTPEPDPRHSDALRRMHEQAFSSAVLRARGLDAAAPEREAFSALSERIIALCTPVNPQNSLVEDQILWARSPVRLDLAGGWSDTAPFCLKHGGAVVNLGVDLNGQAPVQVFAKTSRQPHIVIRSIDLGAETIVTRFEELANCSTIGDPFSLAKAAFCLAGFHPNFNTSSHSTLSSLLEDFGGGIEVSLLAATPKGSGLGTSSILAATLLAALGATSGLNWSHEEIFRRTMALEQLLTSGGGWQDQAGGIYHGVKLIETLPGLDQNPLIRWLPEKLLGSQTANRMALLYYTGITRVAKTILQEIVRGMLLNSHDRMNTLFEIRNHARAAYQSIQRENWTDLCNVIHTSWKLNQALDPGTNTPEVAAIVESIGDLTAGVKLLGAGGGGYMLILAKDENAGNRIRSKLTADPPNPRARFVDFSISPSGLQITRS